MPRKSQKKKSSAGSSRPSRLKFLAGLLIVVLVAGIGSVKYFKTARGKAFLLDSGFTIYYDEVQENAEAALYTVLDDFGLRRQLDEKVEIVTVSGNRCYFKRWDVLCGEDFDLLQINMALTRGIRQTGVRVRESAEEDDGNVLRFEVGTKRYLTHRIFFRKGKRPSSLDRTPRPKLALVIDDFGYSKNDLIDAFLSLDIPLTISVLPSLPFSKSIVALAGESGKEVMLHLPMEAVEPYESDGDMILTSMSDRRIRKIIESCLDDIPGISGVNNHMGSRATQDERVMKAVLSVLKRRKLFFLDSLTSPKSIAYNTARSMGVGTARNYIFLDADTQDPVVVEKRLMNLVSAAKRDGHAVGIGHPKQWTLEVLRGSKTIIERSGVQLVVVSELIEF